MRNHLIPSVALFVALLPGCGDNTSPSGVDGVWSGSYQYSNLPPPERNPGALPLMGAIKSGGQALFFDQGGDILTLDPAMKSTGDYNGTGFFYVVSPPRAFAETDKLTVTGTVSSSSMQLSAPVDGATFELDLSPDGSFSGTPSFSAGRWSANYVGDGNFMPFDLSVDAAGNMDGTDFFGCDVSGTLSEVGTENLYDVTYKASDAPGSVAGACGGALHGLGFLSTFDQSGKMGSGTFFYILLTGQSQAYGVEFKMP